MADPDSLVSAYFRAWNAHDGATLAGLFSDGGTYEDPTTDGPVPASMMPRVIDPLTGAFPDVAFERCSTTGAGTSRTAEWVMKGHNQGPLVPGTSPTGRAVTLPGIDAFDFDSEGIRAVRRYFDQKSLVERAGLMALVQPVEQGPAHYGYSMRVASGNHRPPGTIALTWIQGANEAEKERIRAHSRQNVQDFLTESLAVGVPRRTRGDESRCAAPARVRPPSPRASPRFCHFTSPGAMYFTRREHTDHLRDQFDSWKSAK